MAFFIYLGPGGRIYRASVYAVEIFLRKMGMLTYVDYILIAVLALSSVVSVLRGFVREIMAIVTWVVALWVAWHFYNALAVLLTDYMAKESLRAPVAFLSLFVVTMILGGLVNFLIGQLVDKTGLSGTDRILGLGFGLLRGVLVIGILLMVAHFTPLNTLESYRESRLVPAFLPVEKWLQGFIPADMQSNFVMLKTP